MSLRDAVDTLRKLKVELDTSHRAKAELEVAYLRLVEDLRVARQQASGAVQANVEALEDGKPTSTQGLVEDGTPSRTCDGEREEQKEREERLREELLQAKSALEESRTKQKKLEEDVKGLREHVTETKLEAQVAEVNLRHELQEALAARDAAVEGEKCSQRSLGQVTSEAAKEAGRAAEAEEKLARALEDSAALNRRLEGMSEELEDLKSTGREICHNPEDGSDDGRDRSAMVALETELQSIRETMGRSREGEDKAGARRDTKDAATLGRSDGDDEEARKQVEKLQPELERVVAENLQLWEKVENAEKEASRSALAAESARADVVSKEEALGYKGEEIEALKLRLAAVEEERDEERLSLSRYAEDLEGARSEVTFVRGSLVEALREREELERSADADKVRYQEEVASLRREYEELVGRKDADLSAKQEEVDRKQAEVAEMQAEISEKVARMATEREEAKAAATAAVAAAIVETTAAEQVNAERLWRTSVGSLKGDVRNVEEEREVLRQALAKEKQESESKICEIEEEMRRVLQTKESVEDAAKQSDERAKEAEEETERYKSEVKEMEHRRAAAEEAHCATEKERDAALEEAEKACAMKQEVEDTLLIANKELQRLRHKCEEAESKEESSRAESERLAGELKSLGAAAEEDASKAKLAAMEASEEIASLRGRIQELEEVEARHLGAAREAASRSQGAMGGDEEGGRLRQGGVKGEDDVDEIERERANEAHKALIEERDRLQDELRETRRSAAERTAALETQLGDAEREAADTQRRLYRQQSKLEAELEELRSSHDALRVELARMDAAIQDAADAADRSRTGVADAATRRNGSANEGERSKKDPEELGAELGGAVGGILRGTFWTGRAGGASGSGTGSGDAASSGNVRDMRGATAVKGKARQVGFQHEGESREAGGGGSARGGAGVEIGKRGGRGSRAWTAESESDDGVYDRRQQRAHMDDPGPCLCWPLASASVSRVRHTMMTKLQEAANQSVMDRSSGDGDGDGVTKRGVRGVESKGPVTRVPVGESPASSPEEDGEQGAFIGQSNSPERPQGMGGDEKRKPRPEEEDGWIKETVEHPPPGYGIDSPVIRHLLNQWSSDPQKLKYLTLWLRCVIEGREVPAEFPSGLQLVGLATEVKDGLLTLVVPMIRHTARVPVIVHSRLCSPRDEERERNPEPADVYDDQRWDLRIKVELKRVEVAGASCAGGRTEREEVAGSSQRGTRGRRPGGDAGATGVGGGVGTRERRGVMEQERFVGQQGRR